MNDSKGCSPVVKKPKPHNVSAMLAFAPKELALLIYMMIGDAAIVQAQLNRLNFCRLNNLYEMRRTQVTALRPASFLYLQPGNRHSQGSIIDINMVRRGDGVLRLVCLFRLTAVESEMLVHERQAEVLTSIVALILHPCTVLCFGHMYTSRFCSCDQPTPHHCSLTSSPDAFESDETDGWCAGLRD